MPAIAAQRGVTLIEVTIVVAIAAIGATAAVPSFAAFLETRRLDGIAKRLAADLREARADSILRGRGTWLTFQQAAWGSCYVVHTGAHDQCHCDASGVSLCNGGAAALKTVALPSRDGVSLRANVGSMWFDPLHGTATPSGTVKVVAASGRAVHHIVNVMGRVRSCTPRIVAAPLPGWLEC